MQERKEWLAIGITVTKANTNNVNDSPLFFITMSNFNRFYWYCPNGKRSYNGRQFFCLVSFFFCFRTLFFLSIFTFPSTAIRLLLPISKLLSIVCYFFPFLFGRNHFHRKFFLIEILDPVYWLSNGYFTCHSSNSFCSDEPLTVCSTWCNTLSTRLDVRSVCCRKGSVKRRRRKRRSKNVDVKNGNRPKTSALGDRVSNVCLIFLAFHP